MLLTIITVNYNNRIGLERTIQSVVQQKYPGIEYLVIDGASTDGSVSVIQQYSNEITFWLSEPDKGIYDAMNKGIRISKGEYILFLNSGDYLVDDRVLAKVFSEEQKRCDLIIGRQKYEDRVTNKVSKAPFLKINELNIQFFLSSTLPHQSTFIRRSLFDKCGLYDECYKVSADWVFWIKAVVEHQCTVEIIPYYISLMESGGISTDMEKCHSDMRCYLEYCMQNGLLTWNDIFEVAMKGRGQDFCQRTYFTKMVNRTIIWIGKHR